MPQSGKLSNDLLRKRLEKEQYYEVDGTSGLWRHTWRPIQFVLIVDDFGVEYVGKKHAQNLLNILKKYHTMSEDWEGKKFAGIDLEWNYDKVHSKRTCRLSMREYIKKLLHKIGHPMPRKP